jgi:bifunctional non-homologous end joining protein LigD
VFDVLRHVGEDLIELPWRARREVLDELSSPVGSAAPGWQVSPVFDDGEALVEATAVQGLEGVVAKRRTSRYLPGVRSPDWVKLPHRRSASVVVGGWRPESSGAPRPGALLLGVWDEDAEGRRVLRYCGKAGSGLGGVIGDVLAPVLRQLTVPSSPFGTPVARVDAVGATWVEPLLVVEVRFKGRTDGGRLREPVVLGVRPDIEARDVIQG